MDPPEGCPDGVYDIMTDCWCFEPNGRPPFKVVKTLLAKSFGMYAVFIQKLLLIVNVIL